MLSTEERRLYHHINQLIASDERCYLKVSASACLRPVVNNEGDYLRLYNQLANKYFDFVICKKRSLQPVCVILVDQSDSHLIPSADALAAHVSKVSPSVSSISHPVFNQEQLSLLKTACHDAQLPLIVISTQYVDDPQSLKTMIDPYVNAYA